jgi:hypothetical protein
MKLYGAILGNYEVRKDPSNNIRPHEIIDDLTGLKRNRDIINYQVSHIFGRTKNICMFEAPWNIMYTPKLFDPFTGYETKGEWPERFQKMLTSRISEIFAEFINEFNESISESFCYKINEYAENKLAHTDDDAEYQMFEEFRKNALNEFSKIV